MSSRWIAPIIVIVLALGIVSVYAGTLTGTQVSTGSSGTTFRATWAQGCTDIQAGLNMCDPDRPDGVSVFLSKFGGRYFCEFE